MSLALGLFVGHVHFIFFVLISFASDTRRKPVFQWNMGLRTAHRGPIYEIKANGNSYQYLPLGGPSSLNISPKCKGNFGEIFGNHGEIQHVA